jgi:hypothetical protein
MAQRRKLLIKIDSRCKLSYQHPTLSPTGINQVQWNTEDGKAFALLLPGGVFDGHRKTFALAVSGSNPAPDPPLKLIAHPPKKKIKSYVYENGRNCVIAADSDDPPDIVIDS